MEESSEARGKITENRDTRPVPDPTVLTSSAIDQAVSAVQRLLEAKLEAATDGIAARLNAIDRAQQLLQANADKSPTIGELNATVGERFRSIAIQFAERDTRAQQTAEVTTTAINTAMSAQEKATEKQQLSVTKQIDALDGKITDVKERLNTTDGRVTAIDGRTAGANQSQKQTGDNLGILIGAAGLLVAVVMAVVAALARKP